MKLNHKLNLYFALSKLIIIGLFILLLPAIFNWYSVYTIDKFLKLQRNEAFQNIKVNGLDFYLEGSDAYGSYTMLRDDYIAIQQADPDSLIGLKEIDDQIRVIDRDTAEYRILKNVFTHNKKHYILEIGRSRETIELYSSLFQHVGLALLLILFSITIILDFYFSRQALRPFWLIIDKRLVKQKFPFDLNFSPIKTTTSDFIFLDASLKALMESTTKAFNREREFTANASHELLTPISILRSKIENMMIDKDLSEIQALKLSEMDNTLDRLGRIAKSLLLLARIDSGQYKKTDKISLHEVLSDIISELRPMLEDRNINVHLDIKEDFQLVGLNQELIFHLFYNLINNAIRYNKSGGSIEIKDEYLGNTYQIFIADTGQGIRIEDLDTIFDRFSHHEGSGRHGLGMSIVKSIADYFDIRIKVKSKLHKGTTISLSLKYP
ncbi:sensor histidine kinase [Pedobacter nyackensis]|uniref:histidine kinase n=1 Tax=Pedobacter nyackensis TaxID=475255 RepID=A0A1W2AQF3_9SPHI|nr:HAMP domain-containing sensor histidine kinase [Pedobacter nyackensis]SMC62834.1 Signal transduction histidine kinase [Pedobacter nyackensis]